MSNRSEANILTGTCCLMAFANGFEMREALVPLLTPRGLHSVEILIFSMLALFVALSITVLLPRPVGWCPVLALLFAFVGGVGLVQAYTPLDAPLVFQKFETMLLSTAMFFFTIHLARRFIA